MTRDDMLARLGDALLRAGGRGAEQAQARRRTAEQRLRSPVAHVRPSIAAGSRSQCVDTFIERARGTGASVVEASDARAVPQGIACQLEQDGLPRLVMIGGEGLRSMSWAEAGIVISDGPVEACRVAVSQAVAGVAESGTLVLASGSQSPALLAFLPDVHVVVVARDDVVACYEDAFSILGREASLPRAVNLVTGPSRTGDIGGRIVIGAHGPRRLLVFVY